MSLFNKVLASVGIGSAKVDTKLESDTVTAGEIVKGIVEIQGGNVEQNIDEIYLSLNTTYLKEADDKKYSVAATIDRIRLSEAFKIEANEKREIPFSFKLPMDTPVSIGRSRIWLATGLDIKNAVDPTDKDFIRVLPTKVMAAVLSAVEDLGFRLREADCEQVSHRLRKRLPFVQEFEFVPTSGKFRGRLDELEIVMFPDESGMTELYLQVDRRARGLGGFLSEALAMDETNVRVMINPSEIGMVRQNLETVLNRYS